MTEPNPFALVALATLDRVADGSPRPGRWTWSSPDDYDLTRAAILDATPLVARLPPLRGHALRSAVAHVYACAEWYAAELLDGDDDDARIALEAAIDVIPFLCPLVARMGDK